MNVIIVIVLLSVVSLCYGSSDTNVIADEVSALNSSSSYDMKYGDVNVGACSYSVSNLLMNKCCKSLVEVLLVLVEVVLVAVVVVEVVVLYNMLSDIFFNNIFI